MDKKYISFEEIVSYVNKLADHIRNSNVTFKNVYGLPRGGLTPAVMLSHKMAIPLITDREKVSSDTLVVDEIIDKGDAILNNGFKDNYVVCLTLRYTSKYEPKFYAEKIEDDTWLVFPWEEF